jgi:cytochrome c5
VSNQDSHFFNFFSLVIGLLVTVAILLIALARVVGARTQGEHVKAEAMQLAAVDERTQPFARVAVAGQDNAALAIVEQAGAAAAPAAAAPQSGEDVFNAACTACHGQGIAGAPRMGDKAAWAARIAQGTATLYKHAIEGFQGKSGLMPPKGGRTDLPDDVIRLGVDYMVSNSH